MVRRVQQIPQGGNNIFGNGEGSFVSAEMLKQVDVPTEALLGTTNGALSGAIISSVVSTAVTLGQHEGRGGLLKAVAKNATKGHVVGVLAGTAALGALGGVVRYSRAVKHNEWSVGHYAHLDRAEAAQAGNFTEQEHDRRSTPPGEEKAR